MRARASFWSYVDYFWVSATVVSVFIAITGNTTSRNLKTLADARHQFRDSISDVIFQLDGTIDRSCSANPMGIGSGPGDLYSCPRMRHMLYQAKAISGERPCKTSTPLRCRRIGRAIFV